MSSAVTQAIEYLVQNNDFAQKIDKLINEIMSDGKLILLILLKLILFVVESYNGIKTLKLTYNEIPEFVKGLTNHILDEKNLIPEDQKDTFTDMIETAVQLVMIQPRIKKLLYEIAMLQIINIIIL